MEQKEIIKKLQESAKKYKENLQNQNVLIMYEKNGKIKYIGIFKKKTIDKKYETMTYINKRMNIRDIDKNIELKRKLHNHLQFVDNYVK